MVLEAIVSSRELMKHPLVMLFFAIVASSSALWLAYFTFPRESSILSIAFVTIALVPVIHTIFVREERMEAKLHYSELNILERHFTVVRIFAWFFVGMILTYAFWYAILPQETRGEVFKVQEETLQSIEKLRTKMTAAATIQQSACGEIAECWFNLIFYNNSFVLLLAVLFSFIYGAGAIFLIGWNASVIGVVIGRDVLQAMAVHGNFLQAFAVGLYNGLGLLPHGLPEAMGYFFGAIAGGIISAAISKKKYRTHEFEIVAKDSLVMLAIALSLLFIGAWIEAWIIVQAI